MAPERAMTRWEYTEVWVERDLGFRHPAREAANKRRAGLGRLGWECYSVTNNKYDDKTYYFKRPIRVPEVVTSPRHS